MIRNFPLCSVSKSKPRCIASRSPAATHLMGLLSWHSDKPKCENEESVPDGREKEAHLFFRTGGKTGLGT